MSVALRASSLCSPRRSAEDSGLSSLRRPTEQLIERVACRGSVEGWASAADCQSRQRLRRSSSLTSRNLGKPVNSRPFYAAPRINQLRKSSSAASQSPVSLPFANTSNGLTQVGERLPRSNVAFDTSVVIKRACSCGCFATYEESAVCASSRIWSPVVSYA